jgi:hypothetical protein
VTTNHRQVLACAIAIVWAGSCVAGDSVVPDSLRACAAIRSDVDRHTCYDREMAKLVPGAAGAGTATAIAVPSAAAPPPVLTPEQRFGLSPAQAETKVEEATKAEPLSSLEAKVSGVRPITEGRVLIDLDNGQVWRQVDTDVTVRLKPGDAVTIKRNTLGSYWLSSGKRSWRVKRIQ